MSAIYLSSRDRSWAYPLLGDRWTRVRLRREHSRRLCWVYHQGRRLLVTRFRRRCLGNQRFHKACNRFHHRSSTRHLLRGSANFAILIGSRKKSRLLIRFQFANPRPGWSRHFDRGALIEKQPASKKLTRREIMGMIKKPLEIFLDSIFCSLLLWNGENFLFGETNEQLSFVIYL